MAQLTCEHLRLGYEGRTVIDDLSFSVQAGEYLCVIGENGSGKTTLMRTILGLQKPLRGSIRFGDDLREGGKAMEIRHPCDDKCRWINAFSLRHFLQNMPAIVE